MGGICARHEQRPVSGARFFNMAGLAGMKNGTWIPHGNMRSPTRITNMDTSFIRWRFLCDMYYMYPCMAIAIAMLSQASIFFGLHMVTLFSNKPRYDLSPEWHLNELEDVGNGCWEVMIPIQQDDIQHIQWCVASQVLFPQITLEALVAIPSSLRQHKRLDHTWGICQSGEKSLADMTLLHWGSHDYNWLHMCVHHPSLC